MYVDVGPFSNSLCGQKSQNSSSIMSKAVWGPQSVRSKKAQAQNRHPEKQTKSFAEYTVLL